MNSRVAMVHHFAIQLDWSNSLSEESCWIEFYRNLWPDLVAAIRIDADCAHQRHGVDRIIILPNGTEFKVDEKKRRKDYDDLLAEEWSVYRGAWPNGAGQKIGWTLDPKKRCHFVAYAIPELSKCYLLPFELLRLTVVRCLGAWKDYLKNPRIAQNDGYVTINWPVPWDELFREMRVTMTRRYSGGPITLPTPVKIDNQLVFGFSNTEATHP